MDLVAGRSPLQLITRVVGRGVVVFQPSPQDLQDSSSIAG